MVSIKCWFHFLTDTFSSYFSLLDTDECLTNTHSCDFNAVCNNTQGSYNCACRPGYSRDGKSCAGKITNKKVSLQYWPSKSHIKRSKSSVRLTRKMNVYRSVKIAICLMVGLVCPCNQDDRSK